MARLREVAVVVSLAWLLGEQMATLKWRRAGVSVGRCWLCRIERECALVWWMALSEATQRSGAVGEAGTWRSCDVCQASAGSCCHTWLNR